MNNTSVTKYLFFIAIIIEFLFSIPFVSYWGFVILSGGSVLVYLFIFHIVTLVFATSSKRYSVIPPALGIISSISGLIPFFGWFLHVITFVVYLVSVIHNSFGLYYQDNSNNGGCEKNNKNKKIAFEQGNVKDAEIVE